MSLSASVGSFAVNTSTGNQAVTGVGFQPSMVLFFTPVAHTADGNAVHAFSAFGVGLSSTARRAIAHAQHDNQGTSVGGLSAATTRSVATIVGTGTETFALDFVSHDSDGFAVNVTTAPGSGRIVCFMAIGGTDLTNSAVRSITSPTATGNQAYTGVGFTPDCVVLFGVRTTAETIFTTSSIRYGIGWATSSTARGYSGSGDERSAGTSNTARKQRTDKCFALVNETGGVRIECDLVSMDADGFTLNWSTVEASALYLYCLAIKGGQIKVGSFSMGTATGNEAVTGVGFQPVALMFLSADKVAGSVGAVDARQGIGFAVSSTSRAAAAYGSTDGQDFTIADTRLDRTRCLTLIQEGTPTVTDEHDFVSMDSDGFTLNHLTASGTAKEVLYLALGGTAAAVTPTGVGAHGAMYPRMQQHIHQSWTVPRGG